MTFILFPYPQNQCDQYFKIINMPFYASLSLYDDYIPKQNEMQSLTVAEYLTPSFPLKVQRTRLLILWPVLCP